MKDKMIKIMEGCCLLAVTVCGIAKRRLEKLDRDPELNINKLKNMCQTMIPHIDKMRIKLQSFQDEFLNG